MATIPSHIQLQIPRPTSPVSSPMATTLSFSSLTPNNHCHLTICHHIRHRRAQNICYADNSTKNNISTKLESEKEPDNPLLKVAWYTSELLGIAASLFRSPPEREAYSGNSVLAVDERGSVDRGLVVDSIKQDFQRSYFVTGVQKERMVPEDMYILSPNGIVLSAPLPKPYPHKPPKCSDCAPLFIKAYEMRNAGAVIHSHGMESCIVTMLNPLAKEFRITHMEMIKGIQGHGYYDELVVPIIENTAHERELTDSLAKAIEAYPKTTAVLVRNHGIYVWGDSWISAKTQAECYHYLFDAAIKLHQLGLDWTTPQHGPLPKTTGAVAYRSADSVLPSRRCIVLDIEGTTTPISFVSDVLFPYARANVGMHLDATYETTETHDDIELMRTQVEDDLKQGISGATNIPSKDVGKEEVIAALVANVEAMIKSDRKITALKQLQGHIWRTGFQRNELHGLVFDDVPIALEKWHAMGIKVYIYSSGSRLAQRLLFGNTNHGDLRKYLCGYFDTTVGGKKEPKSYIEIFESLGVDDSSEVLFVTDVYQEAVAAKAAGWEVIISVRPGNGPLPENHGFKTVNSFSEI